MDEQNRFAEQMPQTIGRYKVQESIGFGAMGAVYKAFDPLIKRTLAIKTIRLDIPRQSPQYKSFIERFYHEARISGTLSHPNIVTLFDIGEEGGVPYLAMEFVEGETIASMIDKGHRFHPEKVISLVSQIASALDYAHSKGVIHRDIKPSNVILFDGDRVKVTDFGIAKLVDAEMTQGGTLLGTPSYMSPEQAMGEKLDGRSDIFSLGVCAFEMLSGEQPFPGNNITSILYKLVHVDPVEPASLEMNGLVPQKWHEVFNKVLAKKPDERYQTATEFVQDLEYCLGSWFGAAVGDETIAAAAAPVVPAGETITVARPPAPPRPAPAASPAEPDRSEPTAAMPVLSGAPPPRPAAPPPAAPPKAAPPAPAKAPAADGIEATVVMKAGAPPKPNAAPPPPRVPPPPPRADEPEGMEATVVMKAGSPAPAKTIMMDASQLPSLAPPPVRTPPAPEVAATVAMPTLGSADKTQVMDVTVKAERKAPPPPPPDTVRAPLPADAETVRRSSKPAPAPPAPPPPPVSKAPAPPSSPQTAPGPIPETAPRRGISSALIVGVAALLFLLAAIVAGIAVWKRLQTASVASFSPALAPSPSPTPRIQASPSPPAAPTGRLHVETQPPGATVTVDGEARGVTPIDVAELPLGSHQVKLELKGYETKTQSVELGAAAAAGEIKVAMTRPSPAMGVADILSAPFGATVVIDGNRVGVTPLTEQRLKLGSHRLEIEKEGYETHTETLKLEAGKRARIDAQLAAIPKPTPSPTPRPDFVDTSKVYANTASEVDTLARKVSGKSVSYPENAPRLRSGDSVSVTFSFVATENGEVTDLKILESGGKLLDDVVTSAVRTWKYQPATKKGVKVKAAITFKQTFRAG